MKGRLEHNIKNESAAKRMLATMPDYVTAYYYNLSVVCEPMTCLEYLRKIRKFLEYINPNIMGIDIRKIGQTQISAYFKEIESRHINEAEIVESSNSYRRTVYFVLKSFFTFLSENGYIDNNPMSKIRIKYKTDEVKRIRLTPNDMRKIINVVDYGAGNSTAIARQQQWVNRDKLIIMLFVSTGMRETALTEINIEDVNMEDKTLSIIDKGDKHHMYYLNDEVIKEMRIWCKKRNELLAGRECSALFISDRRQRMTAKSVSNIVAKYAKEALGYEISPHKLRAAYCTMLYEETGDIEFVRDAVGHANIETTKRYIVNGNAAKRKSADIVAQLFN